MKKEIPKEFSEKYAKLKVVFESEIRNLGKNLKSRLKYLEKTENTRARLTETRIKRPRKIWKKASGSGFSPSEALVKIVDILGVRIVCNNLSDQDSVLRMLEQEGMDLKINKINNLVTKPRDDGYRAIHVQTMIKPFSRNKADWIPCEIQIRTLSQDMWGRLSRSDLYEKKTPEGIAVFTKALSKQLSAIDEIAQQIRNELHKPAEKAHDINASDPISPQRLALLFKQKYDDDILSFTLYDWMTNLEEAEAETINDVMNLLDDGKLRKKLDKIAERIREYPLEDSEWAVYCVKVAADLSEESGISAVKTHIETIWNEISIIALRESLPVTIDDFIEELEDVTAYRTKDSEEDAKEIKTYFSILGCMSTDMYGVQQLDTICAIESLMEYYGNDIDEDRLIELIDDFVQAYE